MGRAFWWFSKHQQYRTSGGVRVFMILMVSAHAFKWFHFDIKSNTPEVPVFCD